MLLDSHAHLLDKAFEKDLPEVLERAASSGVRQILNVAWSPGSSRRGVDFSIAHKGTIFATVGVHPHDAKKWNQETRSELRILAANPEVVAWGEIGLDYYRNLSPKETQVRAFIEQMAEARATELPIIVHDREAHDDTLNLLKAEGAGLKGVIHCFSGDWTMARACLDLGYYLSVAGPVTFRKAAELHDVVRRVPLDRLLLETDAPYLTPEPRRGRRNEPSMVRHTAEAVARIKGLSLDDLARATTANARMLFGLEAPQTLLSPNQVL